MHDSDGVPRYFGIYDAFVVDNADPMKLGRVRFMIPGMVEPAGPWAFKVGGSHSSGAKGLGAYDVPPKGAAVAAYFMAGDPDQPRYLGGWHGQGEQLSAGPDAPEDADKIKVFESERFLVVLNGIAGKEQVLIKDKVSGSAISMTPTNGIELGVEGLGDAPLINGVVLASGIDPFSGATYGALGSASSVVTAKKG